MHKISGKSDFTDDLSLENKQYRQDVERYGKGIADGNKERQEELLQNMETNRMSLDDVLNISYRYEFDTVNNCDLYFLPEVDSEGNVIIDKKNKCVKFINTETGKIIIQNYE